MRRPLGSFETAATLTNEHAPFLVVVVLQLDGGPSPERLRLALAALQRRHPPLAVRIVERAGRYWYEPEGTPAIPLEVVERGGEAQWLAVVESELNRPLDAAIGPLARCLYLPSHGGAGRCELALTFQHAAIDGAYGGVVLRDLLRLCGPAGGAAMPDDVEGVGNAIISGGEGCPLPAEAYFPPAFRGLRGRWRALCFLSRQVGDEMVFRWRARGGRRPPVVEPTRCRPLPMTIPAAATAALVHRARRERVTLNGALNAAFLLAVHRHLYAGRPGPLRFMSFADLRPHLRPPVTDERPGSYIAMLRHTLQMAPGRGFWPLAREATRRIDTGSRRGDKFSSLWLAATAMRRVLSQRAARMAATAVSYSGVTRFAPGAGAIRVRGMRAFVSNFGLGPEYTAQVRMLDGELLLDVVYLDADMDRPLAEEIAEEILATLRAAAEGE